MRIALMVGTAVAMVMAASSAHAADMEMPMKAPPLPAPQFSWTGCHVGGNVGLGAGETRWSDTTADGNIDGLSLGRTALTDTSGGVAGGQLGCDLQFGGNWVVGIAGLINWSNISSSSQDQFNAPWNLRDQVDWYASVTGRLGYAINTALIYGRGGVAFAHNNFAIENSGVNLGTPSDVRTGWTVGVGLEWMFAQNWSVFLEGDYYGFPTQAETFSAAAGTGFIMPCGICTPTPFSNNIRIQPSFETLTFGVNYRFGWGGWGPGPY
jgi:outer membrane immunogenic protein